ncbi:MAG: phenylalanine--tRNA ligase subunit beta, partial [bacterium]|nr:phenylalanine--tRNA ligase subunit beta [bacterium]
ICPRYCAVVLEDIRVKSSSQLIQHRLRLSGIHPINNVVDITNYVMLELGIPLHAFDLDAIHPPLTMRRSKKGEQLITLDGKMRVLLSDAIVIEDKQGLIDLAGLMGGKSSGITEKTTRILLHCPIYNPVLIRRTSKALGLRTEASGRFEKKLDMDAPSFALARAVELLKKHADATVTSGMADRVLVKFSRPVIIYPLSTSNIVLGIDVSFQTATRILMSLGFHVQKKKDSLVITPPSFRRDIAIKEDIAEELGRMIGFNHLPKTIPTGPIPMPKELFEENKTDEVRDLLVRLGFTEHIGPTLISAETIKQTHWTIDKAVPVQNPMSKDYAYLRPSLLPSLLGAVKLNQKHMSIVQLFEIGMCWQPTNNKATLCEITRLGLISTNKDFRLFKGAFEALTQDMRAVLSFGPVEPGIWYAEIDLGTVVAGLSKQQLYKKISPFPSAREDISFFIQNDIPLGDVWSKLQRLDPMIAAIDLLDIFIGKSVPAGKQSVTIRVTYQSMTHTLKENELTTLREKIITALEQNFSARIRRLSEKLLKR